MTKFIRKIFSNTIFSDMVKKGVIEEDALEEKNDHDVFKDMLTRAGFLNIQTEYSFDIITMVVDLGHRRYFKICFDRKYKIVKDSVVITEPRRGKYDNPIHDLPCFSTDVFDLALNYTIANGLDERYTPSQARIVGL